MSDSGRQRVVERRALGRVKQCGVLWHRDGRRETE